MRVMWDILNIKKTLNKNCKYWVCLIHNSFLYLYCMRKDNKRLTKGLLLPIFPFLFNLESSRSMGRLSTVFPQSINIFVCNNWFDVSNEN